MRFSCSTQFMFPTPRRLLSPRPPTRTQLESWPSSLAPSSQAEPLPIGDNFAGLRQSGVVGDVLFTYTKRGSFWKSFYLHKSFISFHFTADKWRSLWWPIAAITHSGIQFAPFLLALHGLLHHQRQATSSSEETPSSFSIIRFLLETLFWAAAAYCLAESIIWSGF